MAKSFSEVKFALQDVLMDKVGISAAVHVDKIDAAKDKTALTATVTGIISALDAAKKGDAAKALATSWASLRQGL